MGERWRASSRNPVEDLEPGASPEAHAELAERYGDAPAELEAIVEGMEAGATQVDELECEAPWTTALVRCCCTILDGATRESIGPCRARPARPTSRAIEDSSSNVVIEVVPRCALLM